MQPKVSAPKPPITSSKMPVSKTTSPKVAAAPPQLDTTPDIPQLVAAAIGALMVGVLYLELPSKLTIGPNWLVLVASAVLLAPALYLVFTTEHGAAHHWIRRFTLALLFLLTAALVGSLVLLIQDLPTIARGLSLLKPAVLLWGCNVLIFGIWYWEIDGDGPVHRRKNHHLAVDLQFPQQAPGNNQKGWFPGFIDYLFLAFCTATALSPADTMPLSRRAKLLMMAEAIISMLILVLLVSRSINII